MLNIYLYYMLKCITLLDNTRDIHIDDSAHNRIYVNAYLRIIEEDTVITFVQTGLGLYAHILSIYYKG